MKKAAHIWLYGKKDITIIISTYDYYFIFPYILYIIYGTTNRTRENSRNITKKI